jgi:hypothetical protein
MTGMSDGPNTPGPSGSARIKRSWRVVIRAAVVAGALAAPFAYLGAYYATYRPNMAGRAPGWHHYYMIGSDWNGWEIPLPIADSVFAPANWIDRHLIRTGSYHD